MSTKIFLHFFTLTVASGLSVTFKGTHPFFAETGKNITMQWSINKSSNSTINYIWAYTQSQSIKKTIIIVWADGSFVAVRKELYAGRLESDFTGNNFIIKILNAKYNDSGNYSVEVQVLTQGQTETVTDVATVKVHGGPDFCKENQTTVKVKSNLTVTLCGNPPPLLTYGIEDKIKGTIKPEKRSEQEWYIHDYSLLYKEDYCDKKLYFNASGHNSKPIIWSPEIKVESSSVPGEVIVKKPVTRNENGTTITWDHLGPVCSGISRQYFLNFTNKDLSVYTRNTTNNSLSCGSECINATSFTIWAVIENKIGTTKSHILPAIGKGTTNSGNGGGNGDSNGGGNGGGGTKKKDHSLFVYVLIGLIVLAAILLAFIIIKIRRRKLRKSGQSSSETELELNNCTEEYGAEKSDDHSYDDIRATKTPEKASDYENVPQNNKGDTANYINVNNLQEQEEKFPLYEAACGASAQYAQVDKTKKNEVQQYAQVDKTKKKEIQQYAVVDKSTNNAKNNKPLYAQVNKILKRNSNNYETVGGPNEESHYADIETSSTNRPRKMEKVETNYVEVAIRDDPYDEPPPKHK